MNGTTWDAPKSETFFMQRVGLNLAQVIQQPLWRSRELSDQESRGAVTRRMTAIDGFAGMYGLCSDKTGTITQNLLTVGEIRPTGDDSPQDVLLRPWPPGPRIKIRWTKPS